MSGASFWSRVYVVVRQIPHGRVLAYGDVAAACGSPRAARQVGYALAGLGPGGVDREGREVPWQRVIRKSGEIATRGDAIRGSLQRAMLEDEGVEFLGDRVDMSRFRWDPEAAELE
jgi:methylated-DNA-protein-cysteine methyltransferase-like protein